jgi:DNA methylase
MTPYWTDGTVTLYHGDCREVTEWLTADVLVTDPPYGRNWSQGETRLRDRRGNRTRRGTCDAHAGIAGDQDTSVRDAALAMWGGRTAVVFGDPLIEQPAGSRQALGYRKPADGGNKGTFGGFLRDLELIYLVGPWTAGLNGRTSVLATGARNIGNPVGLAARYGHPHAKPVDVIETLIAACPPGVIADPFAGAGSTLVAARNQGRAAVGVEIEERYCELAARRLSQAVLAEAAP